MDTRSIATLAATMDKPKKSEILKTIDIMFKGLDNYNPSTMAGMVSKNDLAGLYRYFMPGAPKKAKTAHEWVFKATNKKGDRKYLCNAYYDGVHLVATDGHRLHMVHIDDMDLPYYQKNTKQIGYYDRNGGHIETNDKFPEYSRIIPKTDSVAIVFVGDLEVKKVNKRFCYIIKINNKRYRFDKEYVDDAINGASEFSVSYKKDRTIETPIEIKTNNGFGSALVMPISGEDL